VEATVAREERAGREQRLRVQNARGEKALNRNCTENCTVEEMRT
jgi:hypothetical protein